jgi:two-component system OmpR family response regulator
VTTLKRVLIVDESADSRDVLRTLLDRRGATTLETRRPEQALAVAEAFRPHLIVLDAESDRSAAGAATHQLREAASRMDTPIVILGTLCPAEDRPATGQFVPKPYQYGPLIRRIDDLLAVA